MAILPARTLEIEFDTGVWTAVTAYAVTISTRRGRNRESGAFETGTMSFVLRNDDRRFDPDNAAGPYYGKLRPNRRVRFKATQTLEFPVFQGYIDRITQDYGGPNDATATFDCSDLFKILNRVELPGSAYAAEVKTDTPAHWWRLGEPSGSTTGVDSATTTTPVAVAYAGGVTLGSAGAIVRDPDTAATFDGVDDYASMGTYRISAFPYSVEMWIKIPVRSTTGNWWIFASGEFSSGSFNTPYAYVTGTDLGDPGKLIFDGATSTVRVDDDAWHHVVLTATAAGAANETLYIDGVSQGSFTASALTGTGIRLGRPDYPSFSALSQRYWAGQIDEVAVYSTALNLTRVQAHNTAGRTPWNGELSGARLNRIAGLAGLVAGDLSLDAGSTTLQATSLGGTALAYMQKVEETEAGRLFVTRDGRVKFISRYNGDTGSYLSSKAQLVDADVSATAPPTIVAYRTASADVDEATIITRATVSREGSVAVTYSDAAAITEFQLIDEVHDGLLHNSDDYSAAYAQWIVNTHRTPISRVGQISLEIPVDLANVAPTILGIELGDRVTYKRKPQNVGATISTDMRVEAISHATGAHYWTTTLQLSPFNLGQGGYGTGVWDTSLWDQATWGL